MTDLTVPSNTALTDANASLAAMAAKLKNNINVVSPMISCTRTGKLRLPNDSLVESLDVILLDFVYRNQYYPKPYQEGQFNDLVCQAIGDGSNDALVPLSTSPEPQAESCAVCEKNKFGSATNGGRGKACQNQLLLAVCSPDFNPDEPPEIWTVKAQPTALRSLGTYMLKMTEMYGHPIKVVTTLYSDEHSQYPSLRASFSSANPLWEQHLTLMDNAKRALYAGAPSNEQVDASTKLPTQLGG